MKRNGDQNPFAGKLPPHSDEAERGVLGAMIQAATDGLLWEHTVGVVQEKLPCDEAVAAGLQFYDARHRRIYQAMLALDHESKRPDLVLLVDRLRTQGVLDEVGGMTYLAALPDAAPSAHQAEVYASEVDEKFRLRRGIQVALWHGEKLTEAIDATQSLEDFQADVLNLSERAGAVGIRPIEELVNKGVEVLNEAKKYRNQGLPLGIASPWSYFNKVTGGFHKRQVFVLGGESSVGKTSFMLNIALHAGIEQGKSVGILSAESGAQELVLRMMAILARADYFQLHSGYPSNRDVAAIIPAAGKLIKAPLWIDDTPSMTPQDIVLKARRMKARYGCELFILDHIHECRAPEARNDPKLEGKLLMEACRHVARRLEVPMVVLAQLNREAQKEMAKSKIRRPLKSDLRESGYIEQMADNIGILYKDRREADRMETEGKDLDEVWPVNLEVCKQRNGPTGECRFLFRRKMFRYEDRYADTGSQARAKAREEAEATEDANAKDLDDFDENA